MNAPTNAGQVRLLPSLLLLTFMTGLVDAASVLGLGPNAPKRLDGSLHRSHGLLRVGDVERGGPHAFAVPLRDVIEVRPPSRGRHDAMPGGQRGVDERAPQTARASGDEPHLRASVRHSLLLPTSPLRRFHQRSATI